MQRTWFQLLTSAAFLVTAAPLSAQIPVAIQGRVEDVTSGQPVVGAQVISPDSSFVVLTDSTGAFQLVLPDANGAWVLVERIGYTSQRFDLPPDAASRVAILRMAPAAIELAGVTVVSEPSLERLQQNLASRTNAYPGSISVLDRAWLDRHGPIGSVYDLVRERMPYSGPCASDSSNLCVPGRTRTFSNPYPTRRVTVCIDGRFAIGAIGELNMISMDELALIEFYGRIGIKAYTQGWMIWRANTGIVTVMPDPPGGLAC